MPDYSKGQIYIIRNHVNDRVYIGSTTRTLAQRMSHHRHDSKRDEKKHYKIYKAFAELGVENFYIERLEAYPCADVQALTSREGHYIRLYNSFNEGLNGTIAGRTDAEYDREYKKKCRATNAEYLEKYRERCRKCMAKKRANDPEYREKQYDYNRKYLADKRANDPEYRERKAKMDKEYRENKLANDPEYRERERIRNKEHMAHKRATDAEFRERGKIYCKEYREKKKAQAQKDDTPSTTSHLTGDETFQKNDASDEN